MKKLVSKDEMKMAEALENLRLARRVKLKDAFDLNLGLENTRQDSNALNDISRGDLGVSALAMMGNEDTAGLYRMLR
jgi:hypothetical protein